MTPHKGGFLTTEEAAEFLRTSPRSIHERTRLREIPYVRYGRRCLFRADELEMWLEGAELEETSLAGGGVAVRPVFRNGTSRFAERPAPQPNYLSEAS